MNESSGPAELEGYLRSQSAVLDELNAFLDTVVEEDLQRHDGRNRKSGFVVAGILENYYTCVETQLFRIVQEFGNRVDAERWHADLLNRLAVDVPGIRPRVLSDGSHRLLDELRRFRHFKRYYFGIEYDWDKLDFLIRKQRELHSMLRREVVEFVVFLRKLES